MKEGGGREGGRKKGRKEGGREKGGRKVYEKFCPQHSCLGPSLIRAETPLEFLKYLWSMSYKYFLSNIPII